MAKSHQRFTIFIPIVRLKGLEPPRREAPDPKSGVATNYTTAAGLRGKDSAFSGKDK